VTCSVPTQKGHGVAPGEAARVAQGPFIAVPSAVRERRVKQRAAAAAVPQVRQRLRRVLRHVKEDR